MIKRSPKLALLTWGAVLEDFIGPLGLTLETYCQEFRGSWMFGYIEALKTVGVTTVLFCTSTQVSRPTRFTHAPTEATICVLPSPRRYRFLRRRMLYPYGQNVRHMFGDVNGVRSIQIPLLFLIQETLLYLATPHRLLLQEMRREGCDAILCQEYEYPRFDAGVWLGKLLGVPVFATFQGGNYRHSHLENLLRSNSVNACAGLIIASKKEIKRVRAQYRIPGSKLAQIFNPVDLKNWAGGDHSIGRAELGIPKDARVVIWHGRISIHKKGLDILLNAWDLLCREYPDRDFRLVLIGAGDGAAELRRKLSDRALRGVVWIDQFIHDPETLRKYLLTGDVYALPSRYEGIPVALIEAMACGLPVVAASTDGTDDLLARCEADGGLIVPQEDPAALSRSLYQVLSRDTWRRTLGDSARRRVETCCSLEAVGEQLFSFMFERENSLGMGL